MWVGWERRLCISFTILVGWVWLVEQDWLINSLNIRHNRPETVVVGPHATPCLANSRRQGLYYDFCI